MQVLHNTWRRRVVLTCASILTLAIASVGAFAISEASAAEENGTASGSTVPPGEGSPSGTVGGDEALATTGKDKSKNRKRPKVRIKIRVGSRHLVAGNTTVVAGSVRPAGTRRKVNVTVGGKTFSTRANKAKGRFKVRVAVPGTGSFKVKVRTGSDKFGKGRRVGGGKIIAYRAVHASYYGPGLYGNGMACGGTLSPSTLGVAHKTLPCGTRLVLRLGNRVVHTRVVDRGPYIAGRELDLTSATRSALGMGSTAQVLMSH